MYVNRFRLVWFQGWVLGHGANFGFLQPYADVDRAQKFLYLTFRGPGIVIYSYNKTNEMH